MAFDHDRGSTRSLRPDDLEFCADPLNLVNRFARGANVSDVIGSGLGLTIADEVARAHGGFLEINQNIKGPGACVSLVLPLS